MIIKQKQLYANIFKNLPETNKAAYKKIDNLIRLIIKKN